jgi:PAS domain S-box-containing protein
MAEQQRQYSLTILARVQAVLGALVAIVIFGLYALAPTGLANMGLSLASAILGVTTVVYFGTIHLVLARKKLALSVLVLTVITAINIILIIATTGGLDSPYYAFWLLAIVAAGLFGRVEVFAVTGVTFSYYVYALIAEGLHVPYLKDHIIQLLITIAASGLAMWVHERSIKATVQKSKFESLSGQLNEEQLKAQAIMASIGEGVMVINTQRQIQLFNRAASTLTGWDEASAQNIEYNLVLQLHDAQDKELTSANDPFAEAWTTKLQVVRDNLVTTTRSGRKVTLNLSISPIMDASGNPTGAIALFRDISHEKAVERQKDEFVSTASHEMRTPVAAIEGYISLAMNQNVATIDDRARKYLEKAHETIGHLGELFRDLLSVTKAEEGNLQVKIEAVNVSELLQGVVDDMNFVAQKKNLSITYQVSTGGSGGMAIAPIFYVAANPERLREVVMNLIDNAIKFTPEGGITVTVNGDNKQIEVGVSDTGVGIAAEDIDHLFQKFYRIDNSATRTIGGTGLGLYLCRNIIELFNGRIWVTSKPNEGTTFHVMLPRLSDEEAKQFQLQIAATPGGSFVPVAPPLATAGAVVLPQAQPNHDGTAAGPAIALKPIPMPIPTEQSLDWPSKRKIS